MEPNNDLDQLLDQHRSLRQAMPATWNAFFASFGSLRPVQLQAMPVILSGSNVLVTAPTAGGKTEAVVAPVCEQLIRNQWPGLSVLVVTPTRALVNDLYTRLCRPLDQLRIKVGRKTADHSFSDDSDDQVVITTPESVESLLSFRRGTLEKLQVIILDEIHLLDGSPRGDQLRTLLSRLSVFRHHVGGEQFGGLQFVAMSATVSNPRRLADAYLGQTSEIVKVAGQRDVEAHVLLASGTDQERVEQAMLATELFADVHKILVFVNSRKQVDTGAGHFRVGRFSNCPVYGHHGSLSKAQRESTEERFKSDREAICVATMTLEVGIDIGDIDLVICMDPPFSLSSFLQRIGRGCRRLNGRTRILGVARDKAGEVMFKAMIRQSTLEMPTGPVAPFRRSVLFQQVLAYLQQAPKHRRVFRQFERAFAGEKAPFISEETLRSILSDMVQTGYLEKQGDVYLPTSDGWDFIQSSRIYANIQSNPLEVALIDVESGQVVARIAGVGDSSRGIRVAGRSFEILPGGTANTQRVRSGGDHDEAPRYHARTLPYAFDVGACLANYFGIGAHELVTMRIGDTVVVWTWLGKLINSVLGACLRKRGFLVSDNSFNLSLTCDDSSLMSHLREAVQESEINNPLSTLKPEQMVDLGPHFRHLSPAQQNWAREEWLDSKFLRAWCSNVSEVRNIDPVSDLGVELTNLVK
jgi:ATP-dependent Lhr-like helicase